jgi:hypothetical protein
MNITTLFQSLLNIDCLKLVIIMIINFNINNYLYNIITNIALFLSKRDSRRK